MSHWYSPSRGGHAPGHLRDAFLYGIEGAWPESLLDEEAITWYDESRARWWAGLTADQRGHWLTGQLWNCTDVMPSDACSALDLPPGSSYAQGARLARYAE